MNRVSLLAGLLTLCLIVTVSGCGSGDGGGGGNVVIPGAAFADSRVGRWAGTWTNTTTGTSGAVTLTITDDHATGGVTMTWLFTGDAFTGGQLPTIVLTGAYSSTGFTASVQQAQGSMTMTVDTQGNIVGRITLSPTSDVSQITFTGTSTPQAMNISFISTRRDGTMAVGTVKLTKP